MYRLTTPRTIMTSTIAFDTQAYAFGAPAFTNSFDLSNFPAGFNHYWKSESEAMDIDSDLELTQKMDEVEYSPPRTSNMFTTTTFENDSVMYGWDAPAKRATRRS